MAADHEPDLSNTLAVLIGAADRVVAFRSLVQRAQRSGDVAGFFASRHALRAPIPYFHRWSQQAAPLLPDPMVAELCRELDTLCATIDGNVSG